MSSRLRVNWLASISIIGLVVSLLCLLGIANGMYTLSKLANQTAVMSTAAITAKTDRALLYCLIALASLIVSCFAFIVNGMRSKRGAKKTNN